MSLLLWKNNKSREVSLRILLFYKVGIKYVCSQSEWFSGSFCTKDTFALFSHRALFVVHFLFIVLLSCMSIKITKPFMSRPFIHLQFPKSHHLLTRCHSLSRWFCFHGTCVGGLVTCIISRVSSMRDYKWERERKRVSFFIWQDHNQRRLILGLTECGVRWTSSVRCVNSMLGTKKVKLEEAMYVTCMKDLQVYSVKW